MQAIVNGELWTVSRGRIKGGTVLVDRGKIVAVGERVPLPEGTEIYEAGGRIVTPGIVDAHTHLGISEEGIGFEGADYNERTDPVTPHLRALDGINPEEMGLADAVEGGVTACTVAPGSANVVGGQVVAIKTRGTVVDRMVLRQPAGLKVAFGENPKRVYHEQKKSPVTRMATAGLLRKVLADARNYLEKRTASAGSPGDGEGQVARDLGLEAVAGVLEHRYPLRAHAHRADDILTAIRVAEEFGVDLVIEHATEGHKIASELAERGIPAAVGPLLTSRSKYELRERSLATPRVLYEAGVKFALITDHPVVPIQFLPLCAGLAVREGLPEEAAFRAITLSAAEIMGVADRVGSLEAGKDADLVVWSGNPLEVRSYPVSVWCDGELAFRRDV
ncbi:MAG TPA: amidohydrolase [Firmicutes bacterium]|nr:amidohydrolase [Bacillota bacterium]